MQATPFAAHEPHKHNNKEMYMNIVDYSSVHWNNVNEGKHYVYYMTILFGDCSGLLWED